MAGFLLLMQWVLAVHACAQVGRMSQPGPASPLAAHAAAPASMPAAHGLCSEQGPSAEGWVLAQDALCQGHCSSDPLAPVPAGALDATELCAGWAIWLPAPMAHDFGPHAAWAHGLAAWSSPGVRPGWPPLFLTLQVLRN